jgi:hypothetical protein
MKGRGGRIVIDDPWAGVESGSDRERELTAARAAFWAAQPPHNGPAVIIMARLHPAAGEDQ